MRNARSQTELDPGRDIKTNSERFSGHTNTKIIETEQAVLRCRTGKEFTDNLGEIPRLNEFFSAALDRDNNYKHMN